MLQVESSRFILVHNLNNTFDWNSVSVSKLFNNKTEELITKIVTVNYNYVTVGFNSFQCIDLLVKLSSETSRLLFSLWR